MEKQIKGTIHYGFGKEYLPNWGVQEALREIYQNFIDYGSYTETVNYRDENIVKIELSNSWMPEDLNFLRIGNSKKKDENSIGKHGEGLKMAFLILLRSNLESMIVTDKFQLAPSFYEDAEIGECYSLNYERHNFDRFPFTIFYECSASDYDKFKDNLIVESDIEFTHKNFGDIVNKPVGNIYSGGLFVTHAKSMKYSYNIRPEHLPLDRDRSVPRSFDLSYAASKILESYEKWSAEDLSNSDTAYIQRVPEKMLASFEPKIIGNSIEFVTKNSAGEQLVVKNYSISESLKSNSVFNNAIKKLKMFIAKQLGLYDLMLEFKEKHVHSTEALADFDIILERIKS